MIDIQKLARQAGAIRIHERPKHFALIGNDEISAFAALVLEEAAKCCEDKWFLDGSHTAMEFAEYVRAMKPAKEPS